MLIDLFRPCWIFLATQVSLVGRSGLSGCAGVSLVWGSGLSGCAGVSLVEGGGAASLVAQVSLQSGGAASLAAQRGPRALTLQWLHLMGSGVLAPGL